MSKAIPARLHVILARDAPVGVVIRRGPSKHARLIHWDTVTDTIIPGQWLKARVYERRCDLSPDGSTFAYFALNGHWNAPDRGSSTAISRPPYFKALVQWPKGDGYHGGGLFVDNHTFWLNGHHDPPLIAPPPERLRILNQSPYPPDGNNECLGVYYPRLQRDGWVRQESIETPYERCDHWTKRSPAGWRLLKRACTGIHVSIGRGVYYDEHDLILDNASDPIPLRAEWADWDHNGRLVFAGRGGLWRADIRGGRVVSQLIADLNPMRFESVTPPASATRW